MPFHYDSSNVKANEFPIVPEGWHPFKIVAAEEMESSKGNPMILVKCQVVGEPEYADALIWHYVTFLPPENKGAFISVAFRKAIGVPHGGKDVVDAEDWIGKRFMGNVTHETYKGTERAKIDQVSPMRDDSAELAAAANGQRPVKKAKPVMDADPDIPF